MPRARVTAVVLAAALAAVPAACKRSGGNAELPPASGEGAPPLPELPDLRAGAPAGGGAAAAGDARTTGTLVARAQVTVAPRASGTIVELEVDEGDRVKKGDLLFRLDAGDATLRKRAAETQLRAAELQLRTAQTEHDRLARLVAQNAASRQQLEQLAAQVDAAHVAIAAARDGIAIASKAIADAAVRAPLDGVVVKRLMSAGEYATVMPPSPVLVLQDQSKLELRFRLPERALARVGAGTELEVAIPALGATRRATVAQVAPAVDPRTRTIELVAVLDNADGALRPGLMAEVTVGAPGAAP